MTVMSNCGHDGRGQYRGDIAGDQTGDEWCLCGFVDYGQNVVFRYPVKEVRELIAQLAQEAAFNDHIGYDQSQRTTFWYALRESGYHPANITEDCEADCSSGVAAIVKAVGVLVGDEAMASISQSMTTYDEVYWLSNAGFEVLYVDDYGRDDSWLLTGDIVCNENMHTNIVVEGEGVDMPGDANVEFMQRMVNVHMQKRDWPMIIPTGVYDWRTMVPLIELTQDWMCCCMDPTVMIDGNFDRGFINALALHPIVKGMENIAVFTVKAALIGNGYTGAALNPENWVFSEDLEKIVKEYQGFHGLEVDGVVGPDTLFALTHEY